MCGRLHLAAAISPESKNFSSALYLELVLAVGIILSCINALEVVGGIASRDWLPFYQTALHVQFGVYGCAVLATLLFLLPLTRLPALIRIPVFTAFFVWLIWIIVWVLARRAFGIELTTDIVWELFTNPAAITAVGLGATEFFLAAAILLSVGALIGIASDRVSQRTSKDVLRRGCVISLAAFAFIHLPLRLHARYGSANGQPIVVYNDYVPAILHLEQSSVDSSGARRELPNLESRVRDAAYFDPKRLEQLPVIPQPRNIIWINVESLRFDAIEPGAMPRLAGDADHFQIKLDRQHWSAGNATQFGVFSQLTGLSGFHFHNLTQAKVADPFLLLLAQNGYRLRVAKKNQLKYIGLAVLLPPGTIEEDVETKANGEEDRLMVDAYLRDCAARQPGTRSFDFIAFDATHFPYLYPTAHGIFQPAGSPPSGSQLVLGFEEEVGLLRNRYRNACHFVDEQIGRILDDLRARGEFDSTIVVILGDHGEEFRERGQMTHAAVLNDFQARTPLWLHLPGIGPEPVPIDVPTTHLDVVPTILQTLGFEEDVLHTQGRSLLSELGYRPVLALSDTGFSIPRYRTLVTDTYISRWSLQPLEHRFAGVQRRDGEKVEGEDWLREARQWNSTAAEMYELLPDVSAPARKFTRRTTR
jgi:membrane-anchored protein YejM (alkaline phosphatase superfamily)